MTFQNQKELKMPDISMCNGNGCKRKDECYRYRATPDPYWQAYGNFDELIADGECKAFWSIEGRGIKPDVMKGGVE